MTIFFYKKNRESLFTFLLSSAKLLSIWRFFLPKKFEIFISRISDFFFHPKLVGTFGFGISCSKYFFFSEPCNYLDSLVNYHLTSLPNQIFEAKKVAKKKLGFQVGKSHTQGFSLLTGMVFDITWEFWIIMSFFSVAFVMHQCTNLAKFCLQRLRLISTWPLNEVLDTLCQKSYFCPKIQFWKNLLFWNEIRSLIFYVKIFEFSCQNW